MRDLISRNALLEEMERCSTSRLPKLPTKELQQVGSNCFGFINDNDKRIFIYFSRTGGTGVSERFEVYIYEENNLAGKIIVITSEYEKHRRLVVCDKEAEQYADVVRYITKNYKHRDKRWWSK